MLDADRAADAGYGIRINPHDCGSAARSAHSNSKRTASRHAGRACRRWQRGSSERSLNRRSMKKHHLRYAGEQFHMARRHLMLPHPEGEAQSVATAFLETNVGLRRVRDEYLDGHARGWIRTIRTLMDQTAIVGGAEGTAIVRARGLVAEERRQFADAVDQLAGWCDRASLAHRPRG
jgi:hypothetical protein